MVSSPQEERRALLEASETMLSHTDKNTREQAAKHVQSAVENREHRKLEVPQQLKLFNNVVKGVVLKAQFIEQTCRETAKDIIDSDVRFLVPICTALSDKRTDASMKEEFLQLIKHAFEYNIDNAATYANQALASLLEILQSNTTQTDFTLKTVKALSQVLPASAYSQMVRYFTNTHPVGQRCDLQRISTLLDSQDVSIVAATVDCICNNLELMRPHMVQFLTTTTKRIVEPAFVTPFCELYLTIIESEDMGVNVFINENITTCVQPVLQVIAAQPIPYDKETEAHSSAFIILTILADITVGNTAFVNTVSLLITNGLKISPQSLKQNNDSMNAVLCFSGKLTESAIHLNAVTASFFNMYNHAVQYSWHVLKESILVVIGNIAEKYPNAMASEYRHVMDIIVRSTADPVDIVHNSGWFALLSITDNRDQIWVRDSVPVFVKHFLAFVKNTEATSNMLESITRLVEVFVENYWYFESLLEYAIKQVNLLVATGPSNSVGQISALMTKLIESFRLARPSLSQQMIGSFLSLLEQCVDEKTTDSMLIMCVVALFNENETSLLPFLPPVITQYTRLLEVNYNNSNYSTICTSLSDIMRIKSSSVAIYAVFDILYDHIKRGLDDECLAATFCTIADLIIVADKDFEEFDRTVEVLKEKVQETTSNDVLDGICDCITALTCNSTLPFVEAIREKHIELVVEFLYKMLEYAETKDLVRKGIAVVNDLERDAEEIKELKVITDKLRKKKKDLAD